MNAFTRFIVARPFGFLAGGDLPEARARTLLDRALERRMAAMVKEFKSAINEKGLGMDNPTLNRVSLHSLLIGWLRAHPRWAAYQRYCTKRHPRENLWDLAFDAATTAIEREEKI